MKRFRFPLAKIRGLRAQQERVARREFGLVLGELGRVEAELGRVHADLAACRDEGAGAAAALAHALEAGLMRREHHLLQRQQDARAAVDVARDAYLARRRDLRALTRLYEARREAWRQHCLAEEQEEMEDVLRIRPERSRPGGSSR